MKEEPTLFQMFLDERGFDLSPGSMVYFDFMFKTVYPQYLEWLVERKKL